MKNGYFQLICGDNQTALKIIAPQEGGNPVSVKEVVEYLVLHGVKHDLTALNKGIQDAVASGKDEYLFMVNRDHCPEVHESYKLSTSQDRMLVAVRLYPPSLKGQRMSAREFLSDLSHKGIVYGIQTKIIESLFQNPIYCTEILVARGVQPRHGTDARIEYYFDTDPKAKPTLNSDGSVDFFHLNAINHCSKGDLLARLYPEDPGEYGTSVFGEKIKPRDVKKAILRHGRNIILSEDKTTLTAETNGHVTLVEGKVFVSNVFEVENVDISTGDIDYEGSVVVNGNVCTNFTVRAKGNIEVKGIVEGAILEAGGNIIITRGMNGMAKGVLKAGGNVIAKFIENAKVTAGGFVSTESILHSEVMAATEITVSGKRGFITGGRVSAGSAVVVKTLGSAMGADTIVEVGVDPGVKMRVQELQKSIFDHHKDIEKIRPVRVALAQKLSQGIKLRPEQMKGLQEMLVKENDIRQMMEEEQAEYNMLQEILDECQVAKVEVTGEVYAGTKICIAEVSMVVKDTMHFCKFIKDQGDVRMVSL